MKTVSVGELRQNPTAAFDAVEHGETVTITRHNRAFAQLVPLVEPQPQLVSGATLSSWLENHSFGPIDVISWQSELADDRSYVDASEDDPWGRP